MAFFFLSKSFLRKASREGTVPGPVVGATVFRAVGGAGSTCAMQVEGAPTPHCRGAASALSFGLGGLGFRRLGV